MRWKYTVGMTSDIGPPDLITFEEARARLAATVRPLPPVSCAIADAIGCRLAETPVAEIDWPEAEVSMMDGYAVRAADFTEARAANVAFEVAAGAMPEALPVGCAARIFTGATLPLDADAVVRQEDVTISSAGEANIPAVARGSFVRHRGEVVAAGAALAAVGEIVTPQVAGLLVAAGPTTIRVVPRPRLAILATGNELIDPLEPRRGGAIRDGNSIMLAGLATSANFEVVRTARVGDDPKTTNQTLRDSFNVADVVISTGGVSVGKYDFVPDTIRAIGGVILFHRVNIKPGRPILVARFGEKWLLALPGNPASALVGWCLFARPLCETLAGTQYGLASPYKMLSVTSELENASGRLLFALARANSDGTVTPLAWKGSHDVRAIAHTNALLRVPARKKYSDGTEVEAIMIE